tara:strand:+ start:531 stop:1028 length:498 start_codon:yes stop_codon:yes gene_type:complete
MALRLPEQSISAIEIPGGGEITVRKLLHPELMAIYSRHKEALEAIFSKTQNEEIQVEALFTSLLAEAPFAVYEAIATAADVPDEAESIAHIPVPQLFEALGVVTELTLKGYGFEINDLEKMAESFKTLRADAAYECSHLGGCYLFRRLSLRGCGGICKRTDARRA